MQSISIENQNILFKIFNNYSFSLYSHIFSTSVPTVGVGDGTGITHWTGMVWADSTDIKILDKL